jgi:predicted ATP-grasp superfamily ATP-dependent carboligase
VTQDLADKIPVLILGGQENALSIARSLGKRGIPIHVSADPDCWALRSRYCSGRYPRPAGVESKDYWGGLLLSNNKSPLEGSVILTGSDEAIEFVARNRTELEKRYILERNRPELQLALLDKQKTLELARSVGVPTPNYWKVDTVEDVRRIGGDIQFPLIIKPIHSHLFQKQYNGAKYHLVRDHSELTAKLSDVLARGLEVMVTELIPGPDSLLNSYYTYIDENDQPLFHFTKRVIRRFPKNSGLATYHITEWLPETAELGKRFFQGIKLRGLGNIEFKRDLRDGKLKVIESNARFTAAQELVLRSGMDIALLIYTHLTGQPMPRLDAYQEHLRLLFFRSDLAAYRELRDRGELTWLEWLGSLAHRQVFPCFSLTDPVPVLDRSQQVLSNKVRKLIKRWNHSG